MWGLCCPVTGEGITSTLIRNLACQHVAWQEGALAWELNIAGKVPAFQPYDVLTAGGMLNGKSRRRAEEEIAGHRQRELRSGSDTMRPE